jgi:hypothetical protein
VGFGVIQGLDRDQGQGSFDGKSFGVPSRLAANEERDLAELELGFG